MKQLFLCLASLFLHSCEEDFVEIPSLADEFEIMHSYSSSEWDSLSAYYFRKLPSFAQAKIITPVLSRFSSTDVWRFVSIIDKSFQQNKQELCGNSWIKDKNGYESMLNLEFKSFLFSSFACILRWYEMNQVRCYNNDAQLLDGLGSLAKEYFKQHVYHYWPYALQKYSIVCINSGVIPQAMSLDELDYLFQDYEMHASQDTIIFKRPLYENFENPRFVLVAGLTAILKRHHKQSFTDDFRKHVKYFLDSNTKEIFTLPSLALRGEIDKLFHLLNISINS